jgi:hypothetical protein
LSPAFCFVGAPVLKLPRNCSARRSRQQSTPSSSAWQRGDGAFVSGKNNILPLEVAGPAILSGSGTLSMSRTCRAICSSACEWIQRGRVYLNGKRMIALKHVRPARRHRTHFEIGERSTVLRKRKKLDHDPCRPAGRRTGSRCRGVYTCGAEMITRRTLLQAFAAPPARPNFVSFISDDHGYRDCSLYGNPASKAPVAR